MFICLGLVRKLNKVIFVHFAMTDRGKKSPEGSFVGQRHTCGTHDRAPPPKPACEGSLPPEAPLNRRPRQQRCQTSRPAACRRADLTAG